MRVYSTQHAWIEGPPKTKEGSVSVVPPLLGPLGFVSGTMAQGSAWFSVYVALYFAVTTLLPFICGSTPNVQPLLQPYDFLYYSGVRAYFNGDWGKAAELLEKSILAKESLFRVRRKCHDDCGSAGTGALDRLGKF